MQEVTRDIFYQTIRNWEDVPFTQAEGYVRLQSGDNPSRVRYFLDDNIGCAAHVKQFMGKTLLIIPSECLKHKQTKHSTYTGFYQQIIGEVDIVEVNSVRPYDAEYETGMRQAGFLRPVGSFSFALTDMIDLTQPLAFDSNWKRNLKQSETFGLQLKRIEQPSSEDRCAFLRLYKEMCANKNLSMPFDDHLLEVLLSDPHFKLCMVYHNNKPVSGIIYHRQHEHCGLLYAATGNAAHPLHAGFEMYRLLLTRLQAEGIQTFDMEKMAPSTHSMNAVFLFKQGIKGTLTTLCGEWQWTKRKWMAVGMYFFKKIIWKKTRA